MRTTRRDDGDNNSGVRSISRPGNFRRREILLHRPPIEVSRPFELGSWNGTDA